MWREVVIEQWSCDELAVHVHEPNKDCIHSLSGDVVGNYDTAISVDSVVAIGKVSGHLKHVHGKEYPYRIDMNCREFCEMVDFIYCLTVDELAKAKGQIEDLIGDYDTPLNLSWYEVGYLDWLMRERKKELAWECDNPFDESLILKDRGVVDILSDFHRKRGGK